VKRFHMVSKKEIEKDSGIKVMVVGDPGVGKSCLLRTFTTNTFPDNSVPDVVQHYTCSVTVKKEPLLIGLWDTDARDESALMRTLCYPGTSIFLVCFSVVNEESMVSALNKWIPEIQQHMPSTPFLMVGLKNDLQNDPATISKFKRSGSIPIDKRYAAQRAFELGALTYMECSSLKQQGLRQVFEEAARVVLKASCATKKKNYKMCKKVKKEKKGKKPKKERCILQ